MIRFCAILMLVVMTGVTSYRYGVRSKIEEYEARLDDQAKMIHATALQRDRLSETINTMRQPQ
jgi:uncharacterized membrane protein